MTEEKQLQKVNIDGKEYQLDDLSDKAKNILGFVQRLDKEIVDSKFQLDKASLAKKQAIADLKDEVE